MVAVGAATVVAISGVGIDGGSVIDSGFMPSRSAKRFASIPFGMMCAWSTVPSGKGKLRITYPRPRQTGRMSVPPFRGVNDRPRSTLKTSGRSMRAAISPRIVSGQPGAASAGGSTTSLAAVVGASVVLGVSRSSASKLCMTVAGAPVFMSVMRTSCFRPLLVHQIRIPVGGSPRS